MSQRLWKVGGNSWPANSDSLGLPCFWLLGTTTGLLWRWMENSSMMQVTVQPSSMANFSKSISNVEERWAQWVSHSACAWCCTQGENPVSQILGYVLAVGLPGLCLLFCLYQSRVYHWLKGKQNLAHLSWWLCFQKAVTFLFVVPLWDGLMKSLVVLTLIILRHFSFRVVSA